MKKKRILIPAGILLLLSAAFVIYVSVYYHADVSAAAALSSDDTVTVSETGRGWLFDGPSEDTALIFYPGAKVEASAYAPLLHLLAEQGMDVILTEMPLRLAFFDINAASRIMDQYSYENWYVGGHSLGGAMAAIYAAKHGDSLNGIVLCAAYPPKPLEADLTEILLYGSEDLVLDMDRLRRDSRYAPEHATEYVIEGGNHAQFGNYGIQKGDGTAAVSAKDQQKEAVRVIMEVISGVHSEDGSDGITDAA